MSLTEEMLAFPALGTGAGPASCPSPARAGVALSGPTAGLLYKAAAFLWLHSDYLIKIPMNLEKLFFRSVLGFQEK